MIDTYNKLHQLSEDTIKHAEMKCKKAHTGEVPFSPITKQLQGAIAIWKDILKYKLRKKRNLRLIIGKSKRWNFTEHWGSLSIAMICTNLKEVKL